MNRPSPVEYGRPSPARLKFLQQRWQDKTCSSARTRSSNRARPAPSSRTDDVRAVIEGSSVVSTWSEEISDDKAIIHALLDSEQTERVIDELESRFGGLDGFRLILLPMDATLPRVEPASTGTSQRHRPSPFPRGSAAKNCTTTSPGA